MVRIINLDPETKAGEIKAELKHAMNEFLNKFPFANDKDRQSYRESFDMNLKTYTKAFLYGSNSAEDMIREQMLNLAPASDALYKASSIKKNHINQLVKIYDKYNPDAPLERNF